MRVAITGGTGMIGTQIAQALRERGDEVLVLTRRKPKADHEIQVADRGVLAPARLEGVDAVINLAGAPIADRPWTRRRRGILWDSRVKTTEALTASLSKLDKPPSVFLGVGGLGYFGPERGDDVLTEDGEPGEGFLAELAQAWEGAHFTAGEQLGCRTAVVRMSIVLSHTGGVFPLMLVPFRVGIGGWLGNGAQYTSWISIRDVVGVYLFLLDNPDASGVFHGTVPDPVRNKDWCKALGIALDKRVMTHAPKWALRGALGELADDIFLASVRATPPRLLEAGYTFVDTDIEATFRWLVEQHSKLKE